MRKGFSGLKRTTNWSLHSHGSSKKQLKHFVFIKIEGIMVGFSDCFGGVYSSEDVIVSSSKAETETTELAL